MVREAVLALGAVLTLAACAAAPVRTAFPEPPPPHGRAGPPGTDAAPAGFQPSAEAIRAHMGFLASDLLEGREAGTRGYDVAAAYVASEFGQLGLKPAGANGSYLQPVPLIGWRAQGTPTLTLRGPGGAVTELVHGRDFSFGGSPVRTDVNLTAPLVFAGYGVVAPERGRDDYAGLDVRGKIVVVLDGAPSAIQTEERAHYRSGALKRVEAERRGAVGLLVVNRTRAPAVASGNWSMTWRDPGGEIGFRGGSVAPIGTVTLDAAPKLFAGAPATLEAVMAAAARPEGDPPRFALPQTATAVLRTETTSLMSSNVAGLIEGADPVLKDEVVVLTAHLDHLGIRPGTGGDRIANGALDNASGVATLLEVARGFTRGGEPPRRSILVLAVTAEEKGLVGADYFARNPTLPKASLVANVNLDMPILNYDFADVVAFGAERSSIGPAVRRAAGRVGVGLSADPLPEEGLFTRSDHYRFVEQGVPAVFLMTGFANGGEAAFRGFLAGCYHKPCDDLGQPINYQAAARFARVNYEIARELADAPERPRWNEGDFFGRLFAGPGRRE